MLPTLIVAAAAWLAPLARAATLTVATSQDDLTKCSLREAIIAVNSPGTATSCGSADNGPNTIVLGARTTYLLSIHPAGADDNNTGDLNVTGATPLTIQGQGPASTVIDATGLGDRVLTVSSGASVTLKGLKLTGGHAPDGAPGSPGVADGNCSGDGAGVNGGDAVFSGLGGGILNYGTLTLSQAAVIGNHAGNGGAGGAGGEGGSSDPRMGGSTNPGCPGGTGGEGADGGGIYNHGGTVAVIGSTLSGNRAGNGGVGGAGGSGGYSTGGLAGGSGNDGGSGGRGGGIFNLAGTVTLTNSTLGANSAGSGGAGGAGGGGSGPLECPDPQSGCPAAGGNGAVAGAGGGGAAGGGVYSTAAGTTYDASVTVTITNSTVSGNVAGAQGQGGLGGSGGDAGTGPPDDPSAGGTPGNGAAGGNGGQGDASGGGISNNHGALVVTGSTFNGNTAGVGGSGGDGGQGGFGGSEKSSGAGGGNATDGSWGGAVSTVGGSLVITNSTFWQNHAGAGAKGGSGGISATGGPGNGGNGGNGGSGGALLLSFGEAPLQLLNVTVASNSAGLGGLGGTGSSSGTNGGGGTAGGVFQQTADCVFDPITHTFTCPASLTDQNTIVASNTGANCAGGGAFPTPVDGGYNLSFGDSTCPGGNGDPKLGPLFSNGGPTLTVALKAGSAAINQVPATGAGCPATDQRGVKRPQGPKCDVGAYEFATPTIAINSPRSGAKYKRSSRVLAAFKCSEGGITSPITTCKGTVANGQPFNTSTLGTKSFTVTATDKSGHTVSKTIQYTVTS
jgi:hypothetical protein